MDAERQRRVWAAGAYADLTKPGLAKALGTSVDTLKRRVSGTQAWGVFESEEAFLRRVAEITGLPYAFFLVDFEELRLLLDPRVPAETPPARERTAGELQRVIEMLHEAAETARRHLEDLPAMPAEPEALPDSDVPNPPRQETSRATDDERPKTEEGSGPGA